MLTACRKANAQTEQHSQFWNEYAFVKNLHKDWSLEADIGVTSSSTPEDNSMFYGIIQFYVRGWAHYYAGDRWKLTAGYSVVYNRNVPELNQKEAPELRTSLQATYIVLKKRTRALLEPGLRTGIYEMMMGVLKL